MGVTTRRNLWHRLERATRDRTATRELYGTPCSLPAYTFWLVRDRLRWGALGRYIALSRRIPGWTRGEEAVALAQASHHLPADAVVLENGCFLGCSTVLLAGARKLSGSGRVYAIDPFDASGEAFSAPVYRSIKESLRRTLRETFDANLRRVHLTDWVDVRQGYGHEIATSWTIPIDLLFLDGDQSRDGVRTTFAAWGPFVKVGGIIAVHNSAPGDYHEGHDGSLRLVEEVLRPPEYHYLRRVGMTTFVQRSL